MDTRIEASVRVPVQVKSVRMIPEGDELGFQEAGGRVNFTVPYIRGHQMIELELEGGD